MDAPGARPASATDARDGARRGHSGGRRRMAPATDLALAANRSPVVERRARVVRHVQGAHGACGVRLGVVRALEAGRHASRRPYHGRFVL